jgi:uncharacterized protein with PQ loop repeat
VNDVVIETFGFVGGIMLSICSIPEAIKSYKEKACHIGWGMLLLWLGGEIGLLVYEVKTMALPRLINYFLNLLCILVLIFYKRYPKLEQVSK